MKLEQKLTINKLIANDIINYALDDAVCENYIISLNTYLEDFDENTKKYVKDNIDNIINDLEENECVLDLVTVKKDNDIEFNFIFYWSKILNQIEHIVYDKSRELNIDLEYEDITAIAEDIIDDNDFNINLINNIKNHNMERNLE